MVGGKSFLHQLKDTKVNFVVVGKLRVVLTSTIFDDILVEIQDLFNEYADIVVDDLRKEFLPIKSINHHIYLIPEASFPNKDAYKMTPRRMNKLETKCRI